MHRLRYSIGEIADGLEWCQTSSRMQLSKKEVLLLIPGLLLGAAGLRAEDHILVGVCLFGSWTCFTLVCVVHRGSKRRRLLAGAALSAFSVFVGWRVFTNRETRQVHVNFKASALFTDKRKAAITEEMTSCRRYLTNFGFDPPWEFPSLLVLKPGAPLNPGWGESLSLVRWIIQKR